MRAIICAALLLLVVVFMGCQGSEKRDEGGYQGPKTSYGQSVKKAKDLSKALSSADEETRKQAAKLVEED